jgi:hypothetical protein
MLLLYTGSVMLLLYTGSVVLPELAYGERGNTKTCYYVSPGTSTRTARWLWRMTWPVGSVMSSRRGTRTSERPPRGLVRRHRGAARGDEDHVGDDGAAQGRAPWHRTRVSRTDGPGDPCPLALETKDTRVSWTPLSFPPGEGRREGAQLGCCKRSSTVQRRLWPARMSSPSRSMMRQTVKRSACSAPLQHLAACSAPLQHLAACSAPLQGAIPVSPTGNSRGAWAKHSIPRHRGVCSYPGLDRYALRRGGHAESGGGALLHVRGLTVRVDANRFE